MSKSEGLLAGPTHHRDISDFLVLIDREAAKIEAAGGTVDRDSRYFVDFVDEIWAATAPGRPT